MSIHEYNEEKRSRKIMFERVDYTVKRIDGDYAYLEKAESAGEEEKCVARALLPPEIYEGCTLKYEMMSYEML